MRVLLDVYHTTSGWTTSRGGGSPTGPELFRSSHGWARGKSPGCRPTGRSVICEVNDAEHCDGTVGCYIYGFRHPACPNLPAKDRRATGRLRAQQVRRSAFRSGSDFSAYLVSFDGADDDDGGAAGDARRIPEWVAYEMRASGRPESDDRPRRWCHGRELEGTGFAARDRAYAYSRGFRHIRPDWYVRGHLAMRYHAARIFNEAAWNTHTTLNAVPQRQTYNRGSWWSLECLTGAWENRYGEVWIVTGPIFEAGRPSLWIGEPHNNERPVAVPDKLFKVVVRNDDGLHVLAFVSENATEPQGREAGPRLRPAQRRSGYEGYRPPIFQAAGRPQGQRGIRIVARKRRWLPARLCEQENDN